MSKSKTAITNQPGLGRNNIKNLIMFSPLIVIVISSLTAHLFRPILHAWTWVPLILIYWSTITIFIILGGGKPAIMHWLSPSKGKWGWSVFAVILGLPALQMILTQWQLLSPLWVWLPWLLVGLINPFLEEGYWRGLLIDSTTKWPAWLSVLYSSVFFALNHLLAFGVTSIGCRHPVLIVNAFVLGICFSIIYRKTQSLRWLIFSHAIADLLGLSVPVFLNLFIPPQLPF